MFLGIPYAQPPVGKLRFLPPRPILKYDHLEVFDFGPVCPQLDFSIGIPIGEEDCLTLNVFTKMNNSTDLKPVMFWIHGGGLNTGSGNMYNPSPLIKEDVIVVTINYRLAYLGFITMGNDLAPGNLGIRDQILALEWVKSMISYFGGDATRVTLFGESAGGMSVHALTVSPKAHSLFSSAIFQSGTMLMNSDRFGVSRPHRFSYELAKQLNCTSVNYDHEMLTCLQVKKVF